MSGSCIRCRSYAINPRLHGRDDTDLDLCDVCYWRARAESNDTLRAQLEAAEARAEAAEADADRYRWLRDAPATRESEPIRNWLWTRPFGSNMQCLDAAIDAARTKEAAL